MILVGIILQPIDYIERIGLCDGDIVFQHHVWMILDWNRMI